MAGANSERTSPPTVVRLSPACTATSPPMEAASCAILVALRVFVPSRRRSPVRSAIHVWPAGSSAFPTWTVRRTSAFGTVP